MNLRLLQGSFLGRVEKQFERSGLVFSESLYRPREVLATHRHARDFLYLVLNGGCLDVSGGRTIAASERTLVFHPAEESHANEWPHGGKCFHLELAPRILSQFRGSGVFQQCFELKRCRATSLALALHHEFHQSDVFSALSMEGLAVELLATVSRHWSNHERGAPRWLVRVREMLYDQFEGGLSLSRIADDVGVHPAHLSRAFRRHFGQTPGSYLRRIRVDAAADLLRRSSLSIAEIALRTGFSDQSHLTRSFVRELEVGPASYRRATSANKTDKRR